MTEFEEPTPRELLSRISADCRPAVVDWMRALGVKNDDTAARMERANRKIKDAATAATVRHWRSVAAGCRLLACIMEQSSLPGGAITGGTPDERSEP